LIPSKTYLLSQLSGFNGNKFLVSKDQNVSDIIGAMMQAHKIYAPEYDKISSEFWAGSDIKTARKLFDFLKNTVTYYVEPDSNQRIMSPAAILKLSKNDCKNFALFINGVLCSLKRKGLFKSRVLYRFASYKLLDEIPHHVFAVMQTPSSREIYIDPVLENFDQKKIYFHKIDKNPMALYSISGIGVSAKKQARQEKRAEKKAVKAAAKSPILTMPKAVVSPGLAAPKKKKKIVVKIGLAIPRNAFLLLVGLNFIGLATKLDAALKRDANKLKNFWEGLGGNMNALLKKIQQGAKKKRILGIGVAPAAPAAAAAAAAPILVKIAEFLKKIGIDPKEVAEVGKNLLAKTVKNAVNKQLQKEQTEADQQQEITDEILEQTENTGRTKTAGNKNMVPLLIGGAAAIYLLTRKK